MWKTLHILEYMREKTWRRMRNLKRRFAKWNDKENGRERFAKDIQIWLVAAISLFAPRMKMLLYWIRFPTARNRQCFSGWRCGVYKVEFPTSSFPQEQR